MLPVIALVGRPNVGKSTLFNRFTRSRDALVADQPGLTRDRQYGVGKIAKRPFIVVDTGGLTVDTEGVEVAMEQQVHQAIGEADHVLFLLDGKDGMTPSDETIAEGLRRTGKPITLVVNKSENMDKLTAEAEFYPMGLGQPVPIAAAHGRGVKALINDVMENFPDAAKEEEDDDKERPIRIALIGRPNVGKSTLVNRLLGEERVVAFDQPGTTRDAIDVPFSHDGRDYVLVDTAGVRRRAKISEVIEKFSVIKTLQAMEEANVVLLVLDAHQGVSDQDAGLAGHVVESGRALIVVVNKWDGLETDDRDRIKMDLTRKLPFLDFAAWHFISALHGSGVGLLMDDVDEAYKNAMVDLKTSDLTRILEDAVTEHQPPLVRGRRIKLRYAHQGGKNPPIVIIHGNQTTDVPKPYKRYLMNRFRKVLKVEGTPLRIEFRTGDNPYEGRKNKLTERQQSRRRRMMKHVKKGRK